jgi:hypothetical protein
LASVTRNVARRIAGDGGATADAAALLEQQHGVSAGLYPAAQRAHLDLLPAWVDPRSGLFLDVGANEGEWTAAALEVFPGLDVITFEPGVEPRRILEQRFAARPPA